MQAIFELRATKSWPRPAPTLRANGALLYSLQALAGLANKMLRPISVSRVVEDAGYRLPPLSWTSTRKTRSQLVRYFRIARLGFGKDEKNAFFDFSAGT